jgi:hypothetical protein
MAGDEQPIGIAAPVARVRHAKATAARHCCASAVIDTAGHNA